MNTHNMPVVSFNTVPRTPASNPVPCHQDTSNLQPIHLLLTKYIPTVTHTTNPDKATDQIFIFRDVADMV